MSVGKGSIKRVAKVQEAAPASEKKVVAQEVSETKTAENKVAPKTAAKKAAPKAAEKKAAPKTAAKKAPAKKAEPKSSVVAASVISSDDIHEKKFEAVSKIHCDLPIYLL